MDKQRTINRGVTVRGIGLHTARPATVKFKPADPGAGIVFVRTDLPGAPRIAVRPANLKEHGKSRRRTALRHRRAEVQTVEHILAALSGLSIDNIVIEIDNLEVPGLDGSAKEFTGILRSAGFYEQSARRGFVEIEKPFICSQGDASIQILPDDKFKLEYFLDSEHPLIKEQWVSLTVDKSERAMDFFENEIAPSRTFHIDSISRPFAFRRLARLGMGSNTDTTLVIRKEGPVKNKFRFSDEPARHKLLDLLGDLYIFGRHIKGRIVAKKSGHKLNNVFIKRLQDEAVAEPIKQQRREP
jgi:UDP-3-O-acyl N-acetylglucosamine deacetylase